MTRNEENVIRLPRDWLGPPEELVPIGPAARARAAQGELDNGMPPGADAFWSEDSAALHDALQAPADVRHDRVDPPAGLVPPVAGVQIPGLDRLPRLRPAGAGRRVSRWWPLLGVPVVVLLVTIALIGSAQSPPAHPSGSRASASRALAAAASAPGSEAASRDAAAEKFMAQVKHQQHTSTAGAQINERGQETERHHARARARAARQIKARHRAPTQHSTPSPAPTGTAAGSPVVSHSSAPVSVSNTPAASAASSSGSGGSTPAPGPPGPTGIGSISGGCTVKCS